MGQEAPTVGIDEVTDQLLQAVLGATDAIAGKMRPICVTAQTYSDLRAKCIYAFILTKCIRTFKAFASLVRQGYTQEADILARASFESMIDWLYIRQDPEERGQRYEDYLEAFRCKSLRLQDSLTRMEGAPDPVPPSLRTEIEALEDKFCSKYGCRDKKGKNRFPESWSGKSLRARANAVERDRMYMFVYTRQSGLIHGGPSSHRYYLNTADDGVLRLKTEPEWEDLPVTLADAALVQVWCLAQANEDFKLRSKISLSPLIRSVMNYAGRARSICPNPTG